MHSHVFISYSEKDKTFAEMLLAALEKRGTRCWIAPRNIPPGGSYADAIMRAIEECGCFVLVYTVHSNTSPHVLREVERALKFERNIIPVRFDQSEPSRSLDYLLATVHWLSIATSTTSISINRAADQIASCIPVALATKPAPSAEIQTMAPVVDRVGSKKSDLPKFIAVGLIAAVSVGATILLSQLFLKRSQPEGFESRVSPSPAVTPSPTATTPVIIAYASPNTAVETPSPKPPPLPAQSPTVPEARIAEQPRQELNAGEYQRTNDDHAYVWNNYPRPGDNASWSGATDSRGYATGYGTLTWYKSGSWASRYSGTMVTGKLNGLVTNEDSDGRKFKGTYVNGKQSSDWAQISATAEATATPPVIIAYASPNTAVETPSPSPRLPAQSPTVPEPKVAEEPRQELDPGSPQYILRRYFGCFAERNPSGAYQLLSTGFHSAMSFKKYSALFSSTREINVSEINLTNQTQNKATAVVRFQEIDTGYHQTYWEGPIELVREGNEWRIKNLRTLKKVAAPADSQLR